MFRVCSLSTATTAVTTRAIVREGGQERIIINGDRCRVTIWELRLPIFVAANICIYAYLCLRLHMCTLSHFCFCGKGGGGGGGAEGDLNGQNHRQNQLCRNKTEETPNLLGAYDHCLGENFLVVLQEPLLEAVKRRKLAWFGRVMSHDNLSRTLRRGGLHRSRQRKCWTNDVTEWVSQPVPEPLTMPSAEKAEETRSSSCPRPSPAPSRPPSELSD